MRPHFLFNSIIAPGLFFASITFAAPQTFKIDSTHSFVTWHINHFGFSNPSGKWSFEGQIILDEDNPKNSKVKTTINTSHPITGVPKLDEHLQSKDFFDVKQYPKTTFISDNIEITDKNHAIVHGMLTLHGVSKPVMLDVTLNKIAESPITHKKTAGFSATSSIKRSDFSINTYLPGLSDEIQIQIDSEATLG